VMSVFMTIINIIAIYFIEQNQVLVLSKIIPYLNS
jgi:hypothetical protein